MLGSTDAEMGLNGERNNLKVGKALKGRVPQLKDGSMDNLYEEGVGIWHVHKSTNEIQPQEIEE